MDLTGVWTADDGGIYAIRQVGNDVWWVGLSDAFDFHRGTSFANVFMGRLEGFVLQGSWIDVPRGATLGGGSIALQVIDPSGFTEPVRPRLLRAPLATQPPRDESVSEPRASENATLRKEDGGSDGGHQPLRTPQPARLVRLSVTGGFGASVWRRTGDPAVHPNIVSRFNQTWRNDDGTMHDHLKMYKDWAVVIGMAADSPNGSPGLLHPARQNYADFINACDRWADCGFLNNGDPPDGDINFDVQVDRAELDGQPGFWADHWLNNPGAIRAKLDNDAQLARPFPPVPNAVGPDGTTRNMLHCEAIMFGRSADSDHPDGNAPVLLPGWAETRGNRVLFNSRPCVIAPIAPLGGDNDPPVPVSLGGGPNIVAGDRVRVTGFLCLDCHGVFGDCDEDEARHHNAEIHPVYGIDRFQDFTNREAGANLSGVWHCSDVGTYYVRQSGADVRWLGVSRDDGASFVNVFHATMEGEKVRGTAVDVPLSPGAALDRAALSIDCGGQASKTLVLTSDGPAWDGYRWDKIYDTPPFKRFPIPIPLPF